MIVLMEVCPSVVSMRSCHISAQPRGIRITIFLCLLRLRGGLDPLIQRSRITVQLCRMDSGPSLPMNHGHFLGFFSGIKILDGFNPPTIIKADLVFGQLPFCYETSFDRLNQASVVTELVLTMT